LNAISAHRRVNHFLEIRQFSDQVGLNGLGSFLSFFNQLLSQCLTVFSLGHFFNSKLHILIFQNFRNAISNQLVVFFANHVL